MQTKWWRSGFFYLLLLIVVGALILAAVMSGGGPSKVTLPEFIEYAKDGSITTILQNGDTLEGLSGDVSMYTASFIGDTNALHDYLEEEGVNVGPGGVSIDVKPSGVDWGSIALTVILPIVLLGALFYFLFFRAARYPPYRCAEEGR